MRKRHITHLYNSGFTLTELLVAMAITGVVMAAVYSSYSSQQKSYIAQEQVVAMQQSLRVAMFRMEREIRMAGLDPSQNASPKPGIKNADSNTISFSLDRNGNRDTEGVSNEDIIYSLVDQDGDGDLDLVRDGDGILGGGGNNLIAENIDALNFVYLDDSSPPVQFATPVLSASLSQIKHVQITIVARTGREIQGYTNTGNYRNQQNEVILAVPNDGFRRQRLTMNISCRNL